MRGSISGRNPGAAVPNTNHDRVVLAGRRYGDPATGLGIFRRVREQIRDDLSDAQLVGVDQKAPARNGNRQAMRTLFEQWARHLDALVDDLGDFDGGPFQLNLAPGNARDVEKVVDQVNEVTHLAFDDRAFAGGARVPLAHFHELERGENRRERIA